MKTLRDFGAALLNATLMLAIILTLCLIVLVGRVTALRDDTAAMVGAALAPQAERLEVLNTRLATLEGRLQNAPDCADLRAEIAAIRASIPDLSQVGELGVRAMLEQALNVIGEELTRR